MVPERHYTQEHSARIECLYYIMKPHIISDPNIMAGQPVIEGTRITVNLILEEISYGRTVDDILREYPHLTREGVQSALDFARDVIEPIRVYHTHIA